MTRDQRRKKRQKTTHRYKKASKPTRPWMDLGKDILLNIFQNLDLKDRIKGAPMCCSSWYNTSKDSSLWREINLNEFDSSVPSSELVKFVINRSEGSLTSISFSSDNASVHELVLVAESCPNLKYLELRVPASKIQEGKKEIEMAISKLKLLEGMAVNEVVISDDSTLEQISRRCPNFVKLKACDELSHKAASLIVKFLPKLKILDVSHTNIDRTNLLVVLKGCEELENVDLTRCGKILELDEILKIGCSRIKEFKWDNAVEDSCSDCEEEWDEKCIEGARFGCCREDYSYRWPCDHVIDPGFSTYIQGTDALAYEMDRSAQDEGPWELPIDDSGCGSDFDYDDYYNNYDWSCECECGHSSPPVEKPVRDQYDYSYL